MAPSRPRFSRIMTLDSPTALTLDASLPMKRFDGITRTSTQWDALRRDDELWSDENDCYVHLYVRGASRRGPSLKIPLAALERARNPYLLDKCLHHALANPASPSVSEDDSSDSGYSGSVSGEWTDKYCQLYIPPPSGLTKDEALAYHISTRNYFAYILSKPVVGHTLGSALAGLWRRVRQWQPTTSRSDFIKYCQEQGYTNVSEHPDHALAMLYFSEEARIRQTWTEAFVHCAGMRDMLAHSAEYEWLSNTTKALITRASLEMDLHIDRVTRALRSFLEEELGPEYLGLAKAARHHLDRFRSFLQSYYVEKVGYFPPAETEPWDKRLWCRMYADFHSLYEYLADKTSSSDLTNNRAVNGGICVTQNINAFNERHGYAALPHPLSLLPESPARKRTVDAQRALRGLRLGRSDEPSELHHTIKSALAQAANTDDGSILSKPLVQEYLRFERVKVGDKVNIVEARKIRWLLIYSVLQMLISITRAPKEVSDTETPSYPLCVLTTGCPPWAKDEREVEDARTIPSRCSAEMAAVKQAMETDRISIHPDCEAENAEVFFKTSLSRSGSTMSLNTMMMPAPLRPGPPLSRTASLRTSVTSLHRSMVGSLSRRSSIRRNSVLALPPKKEPAFCEILVEGYGNGADSSRDISPRVTNANESVLDLSQLHMFDEPESELLKSSPLQPNELSKLDSSQVHIFDGPADVAPHPLDSSHRHRNNPEPVLEFGQMYLPAVIDGHDPFPSDGGDPSVPSSYNGNSGRSSYLDECMSPASEASCWTLEPDPDSHKSVDPNLSAFVFDFQPPPPPPSTTAEPRGSGSHDPTTTTTTTMTTTTTARDRPSYKPVSVNAGCYMPTGASTTATGTFVDVSSSSSYRGKPGRVLSSDSLCSMASATSSVYGEGSQQAAEIEEEESRGRRRSRALDRLPLFRLGRRQISLPEALEEDE